MWKRKNAQFFFTSQRLRANTSVFFEICEFLLYWVLVLYLSFRAGIYGTKTGLFSRKIKFVIFACSFASIAAALRRRTFFARTKKVPKKYAEGVRTLSTPGNAVKLRLRFAPQVLRRYLNFHSMWKRKNSQFIFTPCRHRANTSMFFGNFWLLVILGVGFMS